jgi:dienelactone hydrolase
VVIEAPDARQMGKEFQAVAVALAVTLAGCATSHQAALPTTKCELKLAGASGELKVEIADPTGRGVPMTVYYPARAGTYPLIAFSHGAFSTPGRYAAMLQPLAASGYVVIAPMHVDSEEFGRAERPSSEETWRTRNEDMSLAINGTAEFDARLAKDGIRIDRGKIVAMGHSYGALVAQLPGGVRAIEPDGSRIDRTDPTVDLVVGWSPPGPVPTLIDAEGWSSQRKPSLTITGTTDILPGFIDDWRAHTASYENAPPVGRALWVGNEIDHYFGGVFGREKPADENSQRLFDRALATTLGFIERKLDINAPCDPGAAVKGESYVED